jgi:hypothetical protein
MSADNGKDDIGLITESGAAATGRVDRSIGDTGFPPPIGGS